MDECVILCVLNRIIPVRNADGTYSLPKEETYYSQDLNQNFYGIQANEAPVESLLLYAHQNGHEVNEIIYLCSNECFEKSIPIAQLNHLTAFNECSDDLVSYEEFFVQRIIEFCDQNGITIPMFNPLPYKPSLPADSIIDLKTYLDGNYEILIDLTGGRRDAVILLMITTQLFKMRSAGTSVGYIVYSNYTDNKIYKQDMTFGLIDLANAIDVFLNYGRADQLQQFFISHDYISRETRNLCVKLDDFSNALLLCQVRNIDIKIRNVHSAIEIAQASLETKSRNYRLVSNALEALDCSEEPNSNTTLNEALAAISQSVPSIETNMSSIDAFQDSLEKTRRDNMLVRSELMLYSLMTLLKNGFIPEADNTDDLIINSIKWCAEHQMIQQALCIFRERISECLLHREFFSATERFNELNQNEQTRLIPDICANIKITRDPNVELSFYPNYGDKSYSDFFLIPNPKNKQLRTIMMWYKYLHCVRNNIMHAESKQNQNSYAVSCKLVGKDPSKEISIKELEDDIVHALFYITSNDPTSNTNTIDKVSNITELKLLLFKFADGKDEISFNEFVKWCSQTEKKQLDKNQLNFDEKVPFYQGLCKKYNKEFSFRKEDTEIYLRLR